MTQKDNAPDAVAERLRKAEDDQTDRVATVIAKALGYDSNEKCVAEIDENATCESWTCIGVWGEDHNDAEDSRDFIREVARAVIADLAGKPSAEGGAA